MTTIYIILKAFDTEHIYVTCFLTKRETEEYIFNHPNCYVKHEVKE